jgi:hypothetical protein
VPAGVRRPWRFLDANTGDPSGINAPARADLDDVVAQLACLNQPAGTQSCDCCRHSDARFGVGGDRRASFVSNSFLSHPRAALEASHRHCQSLEPQR